MWSCGRRVLQELLSQPPARCLSQTAVKNTVVVERWWQVPLSKVGSPPRLHPRRHRIYKLVENTAHSPKQKMELILTQTVEKLGGRGDTVFVRKSVGRNKLLAQGLAVYPSPENKQIFAEELKRLREGTLEERVQTRTGQLTLEYLKRLKLTIDDIPSADVVLTKEIVCRQILKRFRIVVPPHALRLPDEPIKSLGDYWCEITVNGIDTVRIPMSLAPYQDPSASFQKTLKKQKKEQGEAAAPAGEEEEEEAVLKAVSEAVGEPEAEKEAATSLASPAAAGASAAAPDAAEAPQTSQDTSAPPSDTPKKD